MNIQRLIAINVKLISNRIINHSTIQAFCRAMQFDQKTNPSALASIFEEFNRFQPTNRLFVDWMNIMLFNVCAFNEEFMIHCDNQLLQSTEDINKFSVKELKEYLTSSGSAKIKAKLKLWIAKLLSLPLFQKIFSQLSKDVVERNKSLRSLLETIDYLSLKYQIGHKYAEKIKQILKKLPKMITSQTSHIMVERIFNEGQKVCQFLEQISSNYMINIQDLAYVISANYFHLQSPRKIFQKANTHGQVLTEEIADYLIRKINKNELFSQKIQQFKPFQLFMSILVHRQANLLSQIFSIFSEKDNKGHNSIYHLQNQQQIQKLSQIFSFQIPNNYPYLHQLLKYVFTSLLAKYSQADSLQLMKKLILNRFLLNPIFFTTFHPFQKEEEIAKFVQNANQCRILFYQKKSLAASQTEGNPKIVDFGKLLRNSLQTMLKSKGSKINKELLINDKGVYINDSLLNSILGDLSDNFKGQIKKNVFNQSNNSQISLSFSLKNDSMSKINAPTHQNLSSNNSFVPFIPNMPKPVSKSNGQKSQKVLKNISQNISTNEFLGQRQAQQLFPVDKLEHLVLKRREFGQMRRQIDDKCLIHSKKRETWMRSLYLLNQPIVQLRKELQRSSNQINANSLIF